MTSPRWSINKDQWASIGKSLWKYTLPLIIVFLIQLQTGVPLKDALGIVYGAGLQVLINFLSKYVTETK